VTKHGSRDLRRPILLERLIKNSAKQGGNRSMDKCVVYAIVVVIGCAACICIEHGRSILVMLGLQSDERE